MAKTKETQERNTKQQHTKPAPGRSSQALQTPERGERQSGITRREQYAPQPFGRSPFSFMRRFSEEMDRLFEDFGMSRGFLAPSFGRPLENFGQLRTAMWSPQLEMFERNNKLVVRADLPGMTKDDIDIDVTDEALVIRGERRSEREEDEEGYYRSERSYGSFYRRIPLPEGVDLENANATFRDGVLEITLGAPQRAEQSRGHRIEIQDRGEEEQPRTRAKAAGQR
jgi:HSP20 family protein